MGGPDFISEVKNDLKLYISEQMGETYIKRSAYIYVEITNEMISIFTYNLHKSKLSKLHYAIESHIH